MAVIIGNPAYAPGGQTPEQIQVLINQAIDQYIINNPPNCPVPPTPYRGALFTYAGNSGYQLRYHAEYPDGTIPGSNGFATGNFTGIKKDTVPAGSKFVVTFENYSGSSVYLIVLKYNTRNTNGLVISPTTFQFLEVPENREFLFSDDHVYLVIAVDNSNALQAAEAYGAGYNQYPIDHPNDDGPVFQAGYNQALIDNPPIQRGAMDIFCHTHDLIVKAIKADGSQFGADILLQKEADNEYIYFDNNYFVQNGVVLLRIVTDDVIKIIRRLYYDTNANTQINQRLDMTNTYDFIYYPDLRLTWIIYTSTL